MKDFEKYQKERLTINLVWANVFAILLLIPIVVIFGIPYYLLWNDKVDTKGIIDIFSFQGAALSVLMLFAILIFGIVVHELIHGATWAQFAKNGFRSIKFGILWKMLTPYCHCKEPLKVKHYIFGAIAPAVILGFIPSIIGIISGNFGILVFGIFFTMAAGGDFLIINLLRKENKEDYVEDHPSEAGCYIYRKDKK